MTVTLKRFGRCANDKMRNLAAPERYTVGMNPSCDGGVAEVCNLVTCMNAAESVPHRNENVVGLAKSSRREG